MLLASLWTLLGQYGGDGGTSGGGGGGGYGVGYWIIVAVVALAVIGLAVWAFRRFRSRRPSGQPAHSDVNRPDRAA
jgi:hypothetical protein